MQWSRLRATIEERIAPSLGRRVALHQARYRNTNEEVGRVWIAVDGQELASFAANAPQRETEASTNALADLEAYLDLPIDAALESPSALQRGLAVLDARVGKRRLRALLDAPPEDAVVRALLELRCAAEGVRRRDATA